MEKISHANPANIIGFLYSLANLANFLSMKFSIAPFFFPEKPFSNALAFSGIGGNSPCSCEPPSFWTFAGLDF